MLILVVTLAVAALVMVLAMVRFSVAIVAASGQPSAVKVWGFIYLAAWTAIAFVVVRFASMENATWPQAIALVTLVVGGWGTFQAFWVWLWLALERTNARARGQLAALAPAKE